MQLPNHVPVTIWALSALIAPSGHHVNLAIRAHYICQAETMLHLQ